MATNMTYLNVRLPRSMKRQLGEWCKKHPDMTLSEAGRLAVEWFLTMQEGE